ncbi:MAG TPA: hypothetical protein GX693_03560 [Firmicutes bacterium]|nr:hypothetical protein [Bacillota bacterium]
MNIGRAKIALIIAFLGLNLFLTYSLLQPGYKGIQASALPAEELRRIEKFIQKANYILDIPLDRAARTGTFITVAPYRVKRSQVAGEAYSVVSGEQADIYYCPGKQVKFYPGGRVKIHYISGIALDRPGAGTAEELQPQVETFLRENLNFQQFKFDLIQEGSSGERIITYTQNIEGLSLYSSYIKVTVTGERINSVDLFWLEPLKRPQERPMKIIPAAEAVLRLVEELGPSDHPCHIIRLDLGFYSQEYEAEQWDVPPVWRIIIDGQHTYYINAFTGHLENSMNINEENGPSKF